VTQRLSITLPDGCSLGAFTVAEDEPCGDDLNGGCETDLTLPPVQVVSIGDTIGGTFWSDVDAVGDPIRDTDCFQFTVPADASVTAALRSSTPCTVFIANAQCGTAQQILSTSTGFCPSTATACLKPGTYRAIVVPQFTPANPCGGQLNGYRLSLTSTPANCPVAIGTTCADPGPDSRQLSLAAAPTGNFLQGCATGCGINTGGSTDNWFGIPIQGANLLDEIRCMQFGVAALRSQAGTGGGCAYGATDIQIPCKVQFYRDIDGGAPRCFQSTGGDTCDLQLIESYDVVLPSGVYMGSFNLPQPLCVADETNLVFVLATPNLFNAPAGSVPPSGAGYRAGVGVALTNNPSSAPNMFLQYTLCTGAGQNVFTSVGAGSYQWPVVVNGSLDSGCVLCREDLNGDDFIDGTDLGALLGAWGQPTSPSPADINVDGFVDGADLGALLNVWGPCDP
jgi:hypothetical protein